VSQLKKHIGAKAIPSPNLPLVDVEGNIQVAPEKILARRVVPRKNEHVGQWKIKWVNLPETAASWEDAAFIQRVFPSFHPRGRVRSQEGGNVMTVEIGSKEIDSLRNVSLVSYPTAKIASYRFDRTPKIQVVGLRSHQCRRQAEAQLSLSPLLFL
jgi:hypothetical protein